VHPGQTVVIASSIHGPQAGSDFAACRMPQWPATISDG
jgi:hypothetical protein